MPQTTFFKNHHRRHGADTARNRRDSSARRATLKGNVAYGLAIDAVDTDIDGDSTGFIHIAGDKAGLADRCEVELAYAIGVSKPLSIMVDTFGTANVAEDKIVEAVEKTFDLRPGAIIRDLDLRRPIYEKTAAYGHFGREDADFTWEKTDRVEELKSSLRPVIKSR